jgi:hypothetical protein
MVMGYQLLEYLSISIFGKNWASSCVARNKRPVYDHHQLAVPPCCLFYMGNTFSNL